MRFVLPSGVEVHLKPEKVKSIVTTKLSPVFYWMHAGCLTREEVLSFFDRRADFETVKKVCWYILFHAENLVFTVYLWKLGSAGEEDAENYLKFHEPLLKELRKLYGSVDEKNCYEVADKMISLCLKYGIDPF